MEQLEFSSLAQGSAENVAQRVCTWLDRELPGAATLSLDVEATQQAHDLAAASVNVVRVAYQPGMSLAPGSRSLTAKQLPLLQAEHEAALAARGAGQRLGYGLATIGMFLAVCVLCGCYMYHCERRLLRDPRHLGPLLGLAAVTVMLCRFAARDQWQAELTPLLLFGMTAAIVYRQELALLLAASVSLVVVFALGLRLTEFVVYLSAIAATIFLTGRIRSRTRLIYIGLWTGLGVMITAIGVSLLAGQPLGEAMLRCGARYAFWSVLAGLLMTGLLPFIEKLFDVQTDLSLLELGDAAHPLLQELVRRAPGTYNHSINVASMAEAAAEAIGANGLLVRVGAYFHDIGKMLKPGYFVENQGIGANRHESLVPAMSTLVIIAHVKDGADLARQHRLPNSIIDFIEQHHGTTLVEYFYNEAAKRSESQSGRRPGRRDQLPLPGPETADPRGRRDDAGRRRRKRQPHAGRPDAVAHRKPGRRNRHEAAAGRPVRRVRPDAAGVADDAGQPRQVADRRVPRPRQVPQPAAVRVTTRRDAPTLAIVIDIVVSNQFPAPWIDVERLKSAAAVVVQAEGFSDAEISLAVVDDGVIRDAEPALPAT